MSDHLNTPQNASDDFVTPNSGVQPQSRRERRMMEEAAKAATGAVPEIREPVVFTTGPVPEVREPVVYTTGPVPFVEKTPTGSSAPIPYVEPVITGSTPAITAPDVATLTPIESPIRPARGHRPRSGRESVVRSVVLRPANAVRKVRGFVPRAGRALRRAAKETWSTTIRGFVVLVIGAFMVTLTLPSTGFNLAMPGYAATKPNSGQEVTTATNTDVATSVSLGTFGVSNYGDLLANRYGSKGYGYTNNYTGPIRWPFPFVAPISSGFGARVAPCAACSSNHKGLDFDPALGTPIYAIADGVVTEVHNDRWGLGEWVVIHHEVNGLVFDTVYGHMQRDSVSLQVGATIRVADYVGKLGNSGTSTGAHLHLEIHVNGVQVDPYQFLKTNTAK